MSSEEQNIPTEESNIGEGQDIIIPIGKRTYNRDQILKYRPKNPNAPAQISLNIETFSARKKGTGKSPVSPVPADEGAGQWTRIGAGGRKYHSPHSPIDEGRKPRSPHNFGNSRSPKSPTTDSPQFLANPFDRWSSPAISGAMSPSEELYSFQKTIRGFLSQLNFKSLDKTTEDVMNFINMLGSEKNTASSFSPVGKGSNYLLLLVQEICIEVLPKPQKAALFAAFCQTYHKKEVEKGTAAPVSPTDTKSQSSQTSFRKELLNYLNSEFVKFESQSSKKSIGEDFSNKEEMTGFVTFIGELFKTQLLSSKVVVDIVLKSLLKRASDKKAISAAVLLLSMIGGELEPNGAKKNEEIEGFFATLKEISQKKQTDAKLKAKIEELLEMRNKNWGTNA